MAETIRYKEENFKKIKDFLDSAEVLKPAIQPSSTTNYVYCPLKGKGFISLNQREKTIYYSPYLEDSKLKEGLLRLTR